MKIYTWKDGRIFDYLPIKIDNACPVSESWWLESGGTIEEVADPEPVRVVLHYSKYQIQLACQKRNLWNDVKEFIVNSGKQDSWNNILTIASDNEELQSVYPRICSIFGQETVDAVLAESVVEL